MDKYFSPEQREQQRPDPLVLSIQDKFKQAEAPDSGSKIYNHEGSAAIHVNFEGGREGVLEKTPPTDQYRIRFTEIDDREDLVSFPSRRFAYDGVWYELRLNSEKIVMRRQLQDYEVSGLGADISKASLEAELEDDEGHNA